MPKQRIILCTSNEMRHRYLASTLSKFDIELLVIHENSLLQVSDKHYEARAKIEREFFEKKISEDYRSHAIEKGMINHPDVQKLVNDYRPDKFVSYGCSIVNKGTLSLMQCQKINIHLGLSPYYRGTATNFWPLYNNEMQYCGVTFHDLTSKIDGGSIFHQYTIEKKLYETIHHVGNSIIKKLPKELMKVLDDNSKGIDQSEEMFAKQPRRYYKNKDYSLEKAVELQSRFQEVNENYLKSEAKVKIKTLK